MGIVNYLTFLITALVFVMTPGLDTLFVLNKSVIFGKRSGIKASLGVNTGVLTHTLFAALGLSVLIAQSELIFNAVKYLGAIYLVFTGITSLRKPSTFSENIPTENSKSKRKSDFWSGFLTNSLNPKVALFFMAFFPQFVTPEQLSSPLPFIILGVTYALIGVVWYLLLSVFAGNFSQKIKENPNVSLWINRVSGLLFILMGIQIAFT